MNQLLLVLEGMGMALDAIRSNRVRAALTIAGVAIGVFVVVAMGAVVAGTRSAFQKDLESIGATTFFVQRRNNGFSACDGTDEKCPDRRNPPISFEEWSMIGRIPGVQSAIGLLGGAGDFAYRDRRITGVGYDAYSPDWTEFDASDIYPGRNFSRAEYQGGQPVLLVNDSLKARLFPEGEAVGRQVSVNGVQFTVLGVYHQKAGFIRSFEGRGPDQPRAILPMISAIRQLNLDKDGIMLAVRPDGRVSQGEVMDLVTASLRSRRRLKPQVNNTFYLVTQDRLMETFNQLFGAIFAVGLALSAVALLVGGVGVVAIMMISVTERTREIGVRKALGATAGIIRWQFLVEAATLTSLGALFGLGIGAGLAWVIRTYSQVPADLPASIVITALVASAITGVAFGMLPAIRASRLDPVEALRHE